MKYGIITTGAVVAFARTGLTATASGGTGQIVVEDLAPRREDIAPWRNETVRCLTTSNAPKRDDMEYILVQLIELGEDKMCAKLWDQPCQPMLVYHETQLDICGDKGSARCWEVRSVVRSIFDRCTREFDGVERVGGTAWLSEGSYTFIHFAFTTDDKPKA